MRQRKQRITKVEKYDRLIGGESREIIEYHINRQFKRRLKNEPIKMFILLIIMCNNGLSYEDISEYYHIPICTLWDMIEELVIFYHISTLTCTKLRQNI